MVRGTSSLRVTRRSQGHDITYQFRKLSARTVASQTSSFVHEIRILSSNALLTGFVYSVYTFDEIRILSIHV